MDKIRKKPRPLDIVFRHLDHPENKMSKSSDDINGTIYFNDTKDTIMKKFKSSVTDSSNSITYDVKSKPGISNLIEIYSTINNLEIEETENKFNDYPYGEFKIAVAESTISYLEPINEKFNNLGDKEVDKIITNNLEIAKDSAVNTISEVKDALGIN